MMKETLCLHSFETVMPRYVGPQNELVDWILKTHYRSMELANFPDRERYKNVLKRFAVSEKQIQKRHFETDREEIYHLTQNKLSGSDMGERHKFFGKRANEIFQEFYAGKAIPDHLIHVTCTGYLSPSAPQIYFSQQSKQPQITHAYHMGCYASLPSVRMAKALSHHANHRVDVVHTEMCSLHLDPSEHSPEQMVVQTLFADGHIKYSVSAKTLGRRLEIHKIQEKIIPDSTLDMTWVPSKHSMQMTLSKEVPEKIRGHLPEFIRELASDHQKCLFAIHPGGPKIIDLIQNQLELSDEQIFFSRKVLRERGNMSSATLPHIWKEILDSDYEGKVISLAFGPGLTIFGACLEVRR